jgi:hypothetical protein
MKTAALAGLATLIASTAAAQGSQVWVVETPKEADAVLAFGTPGMTDAPLVLRCTPKSGQVQLIATFTRAPPQTARTIPASVTVTSEAASATLRGQVAQTAYGGAMARAEFSTRAPVAAAMRKTGIIGVAALGETLALPPAPKGMVRKFLGACK